MKLRHLLITSICSLLILSSCTNKNTSSDSSSTSDSQEENKIEDYETNKRLKDAHGDEYATEYMDISYRDSNDMIFNSYKNGAKNDNGFAPNGNKDYKGTYKSVFDLIVPDQIAKNQNNQETVVLMLYGGSWTMGSKTDSYVVEYMEKYAQEGNITASMTYSLFPTTYVSNNSVSVFKMLDEIDACIKSIKNKLESLNISTQNTKLVLGGYSAGGHLATLYGYSRPQDSAIPLDFILDIVGPVSLHISDWKIYVDDSLRVDLSPEQIAIQEQNANLTQHLDDYMILGLVDAMVGSPYSLAEVMNEGNNVFSNLREDLSGNPTDQVSPINFIKDGSLPTLMAYAGRDSVVGVKQYASMKPLLDTHNVRNELFYFHNSTHYLENDEEVKEQFMQRISSWIDGDY